MKNAFTVFAAIASLFETGKTDTLHSSVSFEGRHFNLDATAEYGGEPQGAVTVDKADGFRVFFQLLETIGKAVINGNATLTVSYQAGEGTYFSVTVAITAL